MGDYVWFGEPQYELALWSTSDSCGFPQRIQLLRPLSTGQLAFTSSSLAKPRRSEDSLISLPPSPTWTRIRGHRMVKAQLSCLDSVGEASFCRAGLDMAHEIGFVPCLSRCPHSFKVSTGSTSFINCLHWNFQLRVCFWGTLCQIVKQGRGLQRVESGLIVNCGEERERQWEYLPERKVLGTSTVYIWKLSGSSSSRAGLQRTQVQSIVNKTTQRWGEGHG